MSDVDKYLQEKIKQEAEKAQKKREQEVLREEQERLSKIKREKEHEEFKVKQKEFIEKYPNIKLKRQRRSWKYGILPNHYYLDVGFGWKFIDYDKFTELRDAGAPVVIEGD